MLKREVPSASSASDITTSPASVRVRVRKLVRGERERGRRERAREMQHHSQARPTRANTRLRMIVNYWQMMREQHSIGGGGGEGSGEVVRGEKRVKV